MNIEFWNNKKVQIGIISVLIFILYVRVINYEYIGFDDTVLIVDHFKFLEDFSNIPQAFQQDVFANQRNFNGEKDYYRPMMTISLMIDAHIARSHNPTIYHLFNILYHIAACILIYIFLCRLKVNPIAASLLTLLFAIHPAITQAIAWIPGRNDILLTIFVISSCLFLLNYLETRKLQNLLGHFLFFALALFSKENGLALVMISFFYLQFINQNKRFFRTSLILLLGYVLVIIPWFFLRQHALEESFANTSAGVAWSHLIKNYPFLFTYIGKAVLPFDHSVMFMLEDANYIFPTLAIIGMAVGIYFSKEIRWNRLLFGFFWFIGFLIPSFLTKLPEGLEHRLYLPLVGLMIMVAEWEWLKNISMQKQKNLLIISACMALFAVTTNDRMDIFKNKFNFYLSAISLSKYAVIPCINLGADYQEIGEYDKAMEMYKIALKRDPNKNSLHNNIGTLYLSKKNYAEAENEFLQELELYPNNGYAMYNLALTYAHEGKIEQAVDMWKKNLIVQSNNPLSYQHLAEYYKHKGDLASYNYYLTELQKIAK